MIGYTYPLVYGNTTAVLRGEYGEKGNFKGKKCKKHRKFDKKEDNWAKKGSSGKKTGCEKARG
jgi:hypothetical protein